MIGIGWREWVFSVNCFVAAMLALFVSFSIGLERPFWAMTTVYITSQPLSGAVRSKAVFRLIGTAVGGIVTVLLVPPLVNAPVLLSLALALWVAGCQFVSLLDRTPRSYTFMLAGYTAGLIGFPSVAHPELVFDTAVLRVQEIGVGVICAALTHSLFFPRSVSLAIGQRVARLVGEAETWIVDVLGGEPAGQTDQERRRLAADVTELHGLATHLPFDTARIRPTKALLASMQDRLILLLPLVSAVEDRLRTMDSLPPKTAALVAAVRDWVAVPVDQADPAVTKALVARCRDASGFDPEHDWQGLLALNVAVRLAELIEALDATRALAAGVIDPERRRDAPRPWMSPAVIDRRTRPLHRDYGLALLSALATVVAILGCCGFWIATGWPEGATAAMITAVICCFFATMDDPVPAQRSFLLWTAIAVPLTAAYLFAILPGVHSFETLTLTLAPALLAIGALMATPAWFGRMMPLMIGFGGGLALTNSFSAEAAPFINSNVALLIGTAAAIFATRLFRVIGVGTAVRRLRRAGWGDLRALAGHPGSSMRAAWSSRMLDRVGQLAARLGTGDEGDADAATSALRELRIGAGLVQLDEVGTAAALRSAVGEHYQARIRGREERPSPALLTQIDRAIDDGWQVVDGDDRRRTLSALTALRRNFFPAAPAWTAERSAA